MDRARLPADIVLAANRIGPHIRETPLDLFALLQRGKRLRGLAEAR